MRPPSSPTDAHDRADREALRTALGLGVLAAIAGGLRAVSHPSPPALALAAVGALIVLARALFPRAILPLARRLFRALTAFGEAVGTVILTAIYLLLVWPYQRILRLLGALDPPDEPWPPPEGASGWVPLGWGAASPAQRGRAMPGSIVAELLVRAGGAAALLGFLRQRPSFFLVPLVALLLLLGGVVLLGGATGLGPLIYTLF